MQIDFTYDTSVASAPAGFTTALAYAAGVLDSLIANPITVTIDIGWGEIKNTSFGGTTLAEGGDSPGADLTYSQLVADLTAHADNPAAQQELASLPANASSQLPSVLFVTTTQEKAWGLIPANATGADGYVGFNSSDSYDFNPMNQNVAGDYGLIGIAEHEITHALARLAGNGALDLVHYTAPGVLAPSGSGSGYFSLDGGVTNLDNFDVTTGDPADWSSSSPAGDSFNEDAQIGVGGTISTTDEKLLGALGFDVQTGTPPSQFLVVDGSTGPLGVVNGSTYSGPVAGLTQELIYAGTQPNLDITSYAANSFIVTGSGNDAIDVSQAGGNNVLDGGTGSNFLTGGAGNDTFFVDDRAATASIWSSVKGFHAGDNLTVWGITPADFTISWLNGQGAAGATGLTASVTGTGKPDVDITLAGFTTTDLSDGKLAVSYGTTPNEPNLSGSTYMQITAT